MERLLYVATVMLGAGVIALLVGVFTWPKDAYYASGADYTAPYIALSVSGLLLGLGTIALLLWMHAGAVEDATVNALARHEDKMRQQEKDRKRREARTEA